jgi:aspartate kinase
MSLVVMKVGGSVLTNLDAYRRAAAFVAAERRTPPGPKLVVVVSAEFGQTDALLRTATELHEAPHPAAVDLLWSTGELRSVALLVLALQAREIRAAAANVHQTGICCDAGSHVPHVRPQSLQRLLAIHDVIVVPGFLARGSDDEIVSLGRGGSDLTAVVLAAALRADRCELIKDVPGYFSSDPNVDPTATHLADIDIDRARRMAVDGCTLVQPQALDVAHQHRLPRVVRSLSHRLTTTVHSQPRPAEAADCAR